MTPARPDDPPRVLMPYETLADTLRRAARDHGLYVHACPELVQLLAQVDLDVRIPTPLHQAAAELLAWLHGLAVGVSHGDDQRGP